MAISFADLSHHQEDVTSATDVDLAAYARAGHDRIALKATQGRSYVDPYFASWWRSAGALGLARVAYHFAQATGDGAAEFDYFLGKVLAAGSFGAHDNLCLDIEDVSSPGAQARADEYCREFTARAAQRGCPTGIVYTGRWYAEPNNIRPDDLSPGWRRLWISDYSGTTPDGQIRLPTGWTRDQVVARQFSSAVRVAGVRNPCDYSRVLRDWLSTPTSPTHSEDDMPTLDEIRSVVRDEVGKSAALVLYGDDRDDTKDAGTHPDNLQAIVTQLRAQGVQIAAQREILTRLAAGQGASPEDIEAAFETALRDVLGSLDNPPAARA